MSEKELKRSLAIVSAANNECWLTIPEFAELVGFKTNTAYTMCLRRVLPSYKLGKMRRVKKSDAIAWMESNRVEASKSR